MSAMMPPSPSLSARMMKVMYLTLTMIVSAQTTSDRTPSTLVSVGASACGPAKTSFIV